VKAADYEFEALLDTVARLPMRNAKEVFLE
jgi:hypothetical protein